MQQQVVGEVLQQLWRQVVEVLLQEETVEEDEDRGKQDKEMGLHKPEEEE